MRPYRHEVEMAKVSSAMKTGKYLVLTMTLVALLGLAGCKVDLGTDGGKGEPGGGGFLGNTSTGQGLDADGIWLGNTPQNSTTDIHLYIRQGRLIMSGRGLAYFGTYNPAVAGSNFAANIDVYNSGGFKLTNTPILINGNRVNETTLTLAVDTISFNGTVISNPQTMNFTLQTDAWERASALELIAYDWMIDIPSQSYHLDFPISSTGALNPGAADSDGCAYSGALGLLDTTKNLYSANLVLSGTGCDPLTGTSYTGFATLMPDDTTLQIITANGIHGFSLSLSR